MLKKLRIIFAGTPAFAVPALRTLIDSPHHVCAVYTQPDRPAGRGRKLTASPVKQCALEYQCPVLQPHSLRDESAQAELAAFEANVMVVVAYGLILPPVVLATPRLGCLNIHASLLPRWRGAAPIQRALLAGDAQTGITIMQMNEGLDTGDMLHEVELPISAHDTTPSLHDQLAEKGGEAILHVLTQLADATSNGLQATKQDDSAATYAEKLHKQEARIDWSQSADELHRRVRAFVPWPVAETLYNGQRLRIWAADLGEGETAAPPGTVIAASKSGVDVATGKGILRLQQMQLPGGKPLNAEQILAAQPLLGQVFE